MAKNYATIYNSGADQSALDQKWFIKEETTPGTLVYPEATDFVYSRPGGQVTFMRPLESADTRTGRHHTFVIEGKDETTWSLPSYVHLDSSLGSFGTAMIDPAWRVLYNSLFGREVVDASYLLYDAGDLPTTFFSIHEITQMYSHQAFGCFCQTGEFSFPGDGRAEQTLGGFAVNTWKVGIGKSNTDNNGGNTITLQAGEGLRFGTETEFGGYVMIVEADGKTRSADTVVPRQITGISGDTITLDGAVFSDADGSGVDAPVYLVYWEPESPDAIHDPQTSIAGSIDITGLPNQNCLRNLSLSVNNNHELQNFCWGARGLGSKIMSQSGRLDIEFNMEINADLEMVAYLNNLKNIPGEDITLTVGDAAGRRLEILSKLNFGIPEISIPESGTIPVSLTSNCFQSDIDQADECRFYFR